MKEYKYKGYTFYRTNTMTREYRAHIHKHKTVPLYEIVGLKPCGMRPFLTSIQQCKDYINNL